MKGLVLKDLYNLKGYQRQYAMTFGVMIAFAFLMKNIAFAALYLELLGGMLVLTSLSADETVHFERLALTMPISSKTLVKSKYVLFAVTLSVSILIGLLLIMLQGIFLLSWGSIEEAISMVVGSGAVFIITYAITLPIIFKKGVEKGRYAYLGVMMVIAAVLIGGVQLSKGTEILMAEPPIGAVAAIALLVCVTTMFISYKVSVKIIEKKEWN